MIVLSDTTPINHLVLAGYVNVLPAALPKCGDSHSGAIGTPAPRHAGGSFDCGSISPPTWLIIKAPARIEPIPLAAGEVEAISLAIEMRADLLLMDDRRARREAESRGIAVIGTLNVLQAAAQRDLLVFPSAVVAVQKTHFYLSDKIINHALREDAERKRNRPN